MCLKHLHCVSALGSGNGVAVAGSAFTQDEVPKLALDGVHRESRASERECASSNDGREVLFPRRRHSVLTDGQLCEVLSGVVCDCWFRVSRGSEV